MMKRGSYSLKPHQVSYGIIQGDMKRTVVSFSIEQHKEIRALAITSNSNFAATVRTLITEALEARKTKHDHLPEMDQTRGSTE